MLQVPGSADSCVPKRELSVVSCPLLKNSMFIFLLIRPIKISRACSRVSSGSQHNTGNGPLTIDNRQLTTNN
jgi:hypothetical protein